MVSIDDMEVVGEVVPVGICFVSPDDVAVVRVICSCCVVFSSGTDTGFDSVVPVEDMEVV